MKVPPELLAPEERATRETEIPGEISREWLRFALTEAVVLWLPFALFVVMYVATDAVPDSALITSPWPSAWS